MLKGKILKVVLFFVGFLIGLFLADIIFYSVTSGDVVKEVEKFYSLSLPGTTVSVESIKKDGDFFKVLVKVFDGANTRYIEAWVSRDGKILSETVIYLKDSIESLQKYKNFVECLNSKNVRIFGILNASFDPLATQITLQQLGLLGRYSYQLFVSCEVYNCTSLGIQAIPAIIYNNQVFYGVRDVNWFANLTGCKI